MIIMKLELISSSNIFSLLLSEIIIYSLVIILCIALAGAIGMKKVGLKISTLEFITGVIGAAIVG